MFQIALDEATYREVGPAVSHISFDILTPCFPWTSDCETYALKFDARGVAVSGSWS